MNQLHILKLIAFHAINPTLGSFGSLKSTCGEHNASPRPANGSAVRGRSPRPAPGIRNRSTPSFCPIVIPNVYSWTPAGA